MVLQGREAPNQENAMKHYLVTPWNMDMLDVEWMTERHTLFEEVCLPSVMSQKNKDFEWLLIADERTPKSFKKRLEAYPATILYSKFDCDSVFASIPKESRVKLLDSPLLQRAIGLECSTAVPLRKYIGKQDTDYIITSRLDSDDAISIDHIDKIQKHAKLQYNGKRFWLNLVRGLKLCRGNVYPINAQANPFISFVEPPHKVRTAYCVSHGQAPKSEYPLSQVREGTPTWLQNIHGGNLVNKLMRHHGKKPFSTVSKYFKLKDTP
jgi:hypothetical protein